MAKRSNNGSFSAIPSSAWLFVVQLLLFSTEVQGFYTTSGLSFTTSTISRNARAAAGLTTQLSPRASSSSSSLSPTALNVWWFGGTENSEMNQDGDSCELVAVRIERTSANSRKIAGSITIEASLDDVWNILTDYNRLSIHVPNLVESRIVSQQSKGEPGDGSYRCKLFQKGAQKIVGFEFGASVTMAMTERIVAAAKTQERLIDFKCIDSFFFSEFDGEWRATEQIGENGEPETFLNYVVDVRPKGPVPVAALEWRIREDVPTNLRAVKKAAIGLAAKNLQSSKPQLVPAETASATTTPSPPSPNGSSTNGVAAKKAQSTPSSETNAIRRAAVRAPGSTFNGRSTFLKQKTIKTNLKTANKKQATAVPVMASAQRNGRTLNVNKSKQNGKPQQKTPLPFKVTWDSDETMAAYLRE